jgi:hypothetical protein
MTVLHRQAVQNDETQLRMGPPIERSTVIEQQNKDRSSPQAVQNDETQLGMGPPIERSVVIEQQNKDCSSPTSCSE